MKTIISACVLALMACGSEAPVQVQDSGSLDEAGNGQLCITDPVNGAGYVDRGCIVGDACDGGICH